MISFKLIKKELIEETTLRGQKNFSSFQEILKKPKIGIVDIGAGQIFANST